MNLLRSVEFRLCTIENQFHDCRQVYDPNENELELSSKKNQED